MHRILNTGKSGLAAFQEQLDRISNNIANTQTEGYRALETRFESLLSDEINNNGIPLSNELKEATARIGIGTMATESQRSDLQGGLQAVEDPFALAIQGEGYFRILDENGELSLTRNGRFALSQDGQLADTNGNLLDVDYEKKQDRIPADAQINDFGEIYGVDESGDFVLIGQVKLYQPAGYSVLIENGRGYLEAEEVERIDLEESGTIIKQSFVEMSNVDIGDELVKMLETQRAYELNTRSLQAADEMWSLANNMRR